MQVKVGNDIYGWGSDVCNLANDPAAHGTKVLTEAEAAELELAIIEAGWEPFTEFGLEEQQVFLIQPKAWRRPIQMKTLPGQILQVREKAKAAESPPGVREREKLELQKLDLLEASARATQLPEGVRFVGPRGGPLGLPPSALGLGHHRLVYLSEDRDRGPEDDANILSAPIEVSLSQTPEQVGLKIGEAAHVLLKAIRERNRRIGVPDTVTGEDAPSAPEEAVDPVDPNAGKGDETPEPQTQPADAVTDGTPPDPADEPVNPNAETPEPSPDSTYPGSPASGDVPRGREGA